MNLDKIADAVKAGVEMAGGTPILIPAIGVCDGIAMGHVGMKYSLASRELICLGKADFLAAVAAGQHGAAGADHCGHIHADSGHDHAGHDLIAVGHQHQAVQLMGHQHGLHAGRRSAGREAREYFMPTWPMAMPSQTPMAGIRMGVPPAISTPALTASAILSRFMWPGTISL